MQEMQMEGDANEAPWERTLRELENTQIQPPGAPAKRSRPSSRSRKVYEKKEPFLSRSLAASLPRASARSLLYFSLFSRCLSHARCTHSSFSLLVMCARSFSPSLSLALAFSRTQSSRMHPLARILRRFIRSSVNLLLS